MKTITEIYCPGCGAPARFDIKEQIYLCSYCKGKVGIREALRGKQGFREIRVVKMKEALAKFRLYVSSCGSCGANVVFEQGEVISNCAFCGKSMVRISYLDIDDLPENIIPFSLTEQEAAGRLMEWCEKNRFKPEAKKLRQLIPELKGFYLPYDLVRGPVHMNVWRLDGNKKYECEGFINDEFVNRSKQLDNLLLDSMEPFDTDKMVDFDFAYVGGHRVKVSDITDEELKVRISGEAREAYIPWVRKKLETNAVEISADAGDAVRYPVLLPVYYIRNGDLMAAVNGQTGKVSVRAEKESHYYFLPWWFKAIIATLAFCEIMLGIFLLFKMEPMGALFLTGILGFFFIVVNLCLYSDTAKNKFSVESGRRYFTSGDQTFRRERGGLVRNEKILKRKISQPSFFSKLGDKRIPVEMYFTTPLRILIMGLLSISVTFLPVIFALLINGFNFSRLDLGGSAVWFCIVVPVMPVLLLKFGIVELHDNPWIYYRLPDGRKKRYRNNGKKIKIKIDRELLINILMVLFVPPVSLGVWFGIISFCVMVYLTAGFG